MASAGFGAAFRHLRGLFGAGSVVALDDGQLLARYESGRDEAAFEALIGRHGPMVLTTCRAVLKNEHDVEDAFQATFLVLARKAGSIRGNDALAGWLHRVAYRASVQAGSEAARRRRKEAEASEIARMNAPRPDPELGAILHEEVDRLPEAHRLPVVLCDLEGLTYEQAAHHLHWTVPTLRNRLARGRQALKARLTRRGVMAPAIVALLASKVSAAVPPTLARMTLAAATGGTASAGATLLTHIVSRGILMTQIKLATTAALAVLALASAGWIAAGTGRAEVPEPSTTAEARARASAEQGPVAEVPTPVEMVEVRGRVVAPDGRPVAGATVRGAYYFDDKMVTVEGVPAGADGRFSIRLPKSSGTNLYGLSNPSPWLLATAPGYGPGWTGGTSKPDRSGELVATLAEEGPPIEGRVLDLEGRPVAGVRVEVAQIYHDPKNDLAGWIARARDGTPSDFLSGLVGLGIRVDRLVPMVAATSPDGRFRLGGIGRDRVAKLDMSGPEIATAHAYVMIRDEPEIRSTERKSLRPRPFVIHAPGFQLALAPSRRVEGMVRDTDTGRPIAGLLIRAGVFDDYYRRPAEPVEATTDAEGRYRLDGLPVAPAYRLIPSPRPDLPYPEGSFRAPAETPPPGPVAFDFALKRGIVVRGRIIDKVTGRPVRGTVNYRALTGNPHVGEFPGFSQAVDMPSASTRDDGLYEIIALPGPGLFAVKNFENRYRAATGLEAIRGYDAGMKGFNTVTVPIHAGDYNHFAETNFDPKAGPATVDLPLDPGRSVAIRVVDPQGRSLGGTKAFSKGYLVWPRGVDQESTSFEVHDLDPTQSRRMTLTHADRKLAGTVLLKGGEPGPATVRLAPWGTLAGRIVDDEGQPRKDIGFMSSDRLTARDSKPGDADDRGTLPAGMARVPDDGRFRIEGLVPGLKYGAYAIERGRGLGYVFRDAIVAPGEVKDLGDLKIQPASPRGD